MKQVLIIIVFIFYAIPSLAQVGIGTNTPDPSSILHIQSEDKGLLISRMTITERDAIQNPATGLLIYQTNSNPGFYYFNSINWIPFNDSGWLLTGNDGTSPGDNFAGTIDNQDLAIGTQNSELMRILGNGNVGIGTTNPLTPLHIVNQNTPTVIYSQDFETIPTGTINQDPSIDPYWINLNNGSNCGNNDDWQVQLNDSDAVCTNCNGNRAILNSFSSFCNQNATLVLGSFSSQGNSVQIDFDYSLDPATVSFFPPNFRVFLFNETTQTEETTLFTLESEAIDLSFSDSFITIPENLYSLRFTYIGQRLDGITLDNILIQDNGFSPLRIVDGNEDIGKILVSDANGNASWQDIDSVNFQDDWEFQNPQNFTNLDPIFHQGPVKIGDFDIAQHTLHVQQGNNISGTNTYWGSVEEVNDNNGFLEFNNLVSPINSNSINIGSPTNRWTALFSDNGVINTSDKRLKENIQPLSYGLKEVLKLRPISFRWKIELMDDFIIPEDQQETKLGFIAQEILEILPEIVQTHHWREYEENLGQLQKEEMIRYGLSYSELIPVLANAIQEQQEQIELLEEQQKKLKKISKK
ncbi:tail fiber domain-containing protein [uncultured Dokdonia sp.]|uniref:tail fiber domain-containing protein n=1 Tax=uncultured Dokdonia sp. TaxID=575653 RepID=UPI00261E3780|nr:tail fiber domain-containing protein [uncultured Dokdonia sp.]